jgi:hypothetical protein
MKSYAGFFLLLLFVHVKIEGQAYRNGMGINLYGGYVASHHDYIKHLDAHTLGIEFRYSRMYTQESAGWAKDMRLPRRGIALMILNQGQPRLTGYAIACIPHAEFRISGVRNGSFWFRLGTGIAWLTQRYDAEKNRKQIAIGAHLNPVMQFSFLWHHQISDALEWDLGIGLTHFSNGNFNLPNLGMNIPNLHAGITFAKGEHGRQKKTMIDSRHKWKWEADMALHWATKEEGLVSYERFGIIGLSLKAQVHRNRISRFFAGVEGFKDNTYAFRNQNDRGLISTLELAGTIGHRLMMGKWILLKEIGIYVYKPDSIKATWYQRIGVQYVFPKHLYAGVSLKTHMSISDYVQFTVGTFLSKSKI